MHTSQSSQGSITHDKRIDITASASIVQKVYDYHAKLQQDPSKASAFLRNYCIRFGFDLTKITQLELWQAILRTKEPVVFAESMIKLDGSDWNKDEYEILAGCGQVTERLTYANGVWGSRGDWQAYKEYSQPFKQLVISISAPLLKKGFPDYERIVKNGDIDLTEYYIVLEERLVPLLLQLNKRVGDKEIVISLSGLGCGAFAGKFKGIMGEYLTYSVKEILHRHADKLPNKQTFIFDGFDECRWENAVFGSNGHIKYRVRSKHTKLDSDQGKALPQLSKAQEYEEIEGEFANALKAKINAADPCSLDGNEGLMLINETDDGASACGTNIAEILLPNVKGEFKSGKSADNPPKFICTASSDGKWGEELVKAKGELMPLTAETLHIYDLNSGKELSYESIVKKTTTGELQPYATTQAMQLGIGFDSKDFSLLQKIYSIMGEVKKPVEIVDVLKHNIANKSNEEKNKFFYQILEEKGFLNDIVGLPKVDYQSRDSLEKAINTVAEYYRVHPTPIILNAEEVKLYEPVKEKLKSVVTKEDLKILEPIMLGVHPKEYAWLVDILDSKPEDEYIKGNKLYEWLCTFINLSSVGGRYKDLSKKYFNDFISRLLESKLISGQQQEYNYQKDLLEILALKINNGYRSIRITEKQLRGIKDEALNLVEGLSKPAICICALLYGYKYHLLPGIAATPPSETVTYKAPSYIIEYRRQLQDSDTKLRISKEIELYTTKYNRITVPENRSYFSWLEHLGVGGIVEAQSQNYPLPASLYLFTDENKASQFVLLLNKLASANIKYLKESSTYKLKAPKDQSELKTYSCFVDENDRSRLLSLYRNKCSGSTCNNEAHLKVVEIAKKKLNEYDTISQGKVIAEVTGSRFSTMKVDSKIQTLGILLRNQRVSYSWTDGAQKSEKGTGWHMDEAANAAEIALRIYYAENYREFSAKERECFENLLQLMVKTNDEGQFIDCFKNQASTIEYILNSAKDAKNGDYNTRMQSAKPMFAENAFTLLRGGERLIMSSQVPKDLTSLRKGIVSQSGNWKPVYYMQPHFIHSNVAEKPNYPLNLQGPETDIFFFQAGGMDSHSSLRIFYKEKTEDGVPNVTHPNRRPGGYRYFFVKADGGALTTNVKGDSCIGIEIREILPYFIFPEGSYKQEVDRFQFAPNQIDSIKPMSEKEKEDLNSNVSDYRYAMMRTLQSIMHAESVMMTLKWPTTANSGVDHGEAKSNTLSPEALKANNNLWYQCKNHIEMLKGPVINEIRTPKQLTGNCSVFSIMLVIIAYLGIKLPNGYAIGYDVMQRFKSLDNTRSKQDLTQLEEILTPKDVLAEKEKKRLEEEEKKRLEDAERKRREEEEKKRLEDAERKRREEEEKKRLEDAERKRREEEEKKRLEESKKAEEQRKQEEEKKRREGEAKKVEKALQSKRKYSVLAGLSSAAITYGAINYLTSTAIFSATVCHLPLIGNPVTLGASIVVGAAVAASTYYYTKPTTTATTGVPG